MKDKKLRIRKGWLITSIIKISLIGAFIASLFYEIANCKYALDRFVNELMLLLSYVILLVNVGLFLLMYFHYYKKNCTRFFISGSVLYLLVFIIKLTFSMFMIGASLLCGLIFYSSIIFDIVWMCFSGELFNANYKIKNKVN